MMAHISGLRRRALAYRYDFNPDTNARIISEVRDTMGRHLDDTDTERRARARTVAHYLAQLALRPKWSMWLFEIAAVFTLPIFLLYAGLKGLVENQGRLKPVDGVRLVFSQRFEINPEIFCIPGDLANTEITTRSLAGGFLLPRDLERTLKMLTAALRLRTPFPVQLALKCAVDLSKVRSALNGLTPKWIIVYWEYSCSLSFVNGCLREEGIATYNVMHGDKNYYAKNAFFEVERCYCWDQHYADLFRREFVRAEFKIFQNPRFVHSKSSEPNGRSEGIGFIVPDLATLSSNSQEAQRAMKQIAKACNQLAKYHDVSIRPHPVYKESFHVLRPYVDAGLKIVTNDQENARTFIMRRSLIIGTRSTMLLEAAHLDRNVIMLDTPANAKQEKHHYVGSYPNVVTCSIETLASTSEKILAGDDHLRFTQSEKTDRYSI